MVADEARRGSRQASRRECARVWASVGVDVAKGIRVVRLDRHTLRRLTIRGKETSV